MNNLADLLAYPPFRYARYLRAARATKLFRREEVFGASRPTDSSGIPGVASTVLPR
jgi:hypothetical protein